MGTPLFDQLSDELILEIANQTERRYGNTSLVPLALCSRRLNNIASPLLYRSFTQRSTNLAALPALLRTVMQKPILGSEIKKLDLIDLKDLLDMSSFSRVDFRRCHIAIRSLEVSIDKVNWKLGLRQGDWDAVVSLLLLFLPSLEEIEIRSDDVESFTYLDQIARHIIFNQLIENPIRQVFSLSNLQRFSFASLSNDVYTHIGVILPWCELPSMRTIRAFMVEGAEEWVSSPSPFSKKNYVQNLRMENSSINNAVLRSLLPCFVSLKRLYYHRGGAHAEPTDFLPQKVGEALAHLHDCLEELVLLDLDWAAYFADDEAPGPLGSLAEFTKLRCIGTEAEVLFGPDLGIERPQLADILPASLECLVIRRCEDEIYHDLRGLLHHGKNNFHALKTVAIDIPKARAGGLNGIGPDGQHQREEEIKRCLKRLAIDHDTAIAEGTQLQELTIELESIQSNRPTPEDWQAWRIRQLVEQDLITDYKDAGIELRFNLYSGNTSTFMPSFMVY